MSHTLSITKTSRAVAPGPPHYSLSLPLSPPYLPIFAHFKTLLINMNIALLFLIPQITPNNYHSPPTPA